MKRIILFIILLACCSRTIAQTTYISNPLRISLYGGAGLATSNNYDMGVSAGIEGEKGISGFTTIGAALFMQGYSLLYDNEANSAKHGLGYSGFILRHKSNYVF